MKKVFFSILFILLSENVICAINVSPYFEGNSNFNLLVPPKSTKTIPLDALNIGSTIEAKVYSLNQSYKDIRACIVNEQELQYNNPSFICPNSRHFVAPFAIGKTTQSTDKLFLVLDNSFANFITKKLHIQLKYKNHLTDEEIIKIKMPLEQMQEAIESTYINSGIDVNIKPCGQSNAYSETTNANITICTELIHEILNTENRGAIVAVLLHEYGHSLLNRWNEPGSSEEDMADQFATIMLLKAGNNGRAVLQQWMGYWSKRNSVLEAKNQLLHGDTHSLSIQRARNIQNIINFPDDALRRWNNLLYRNMSSEGLNITKKNATRYDDLDLLNEAIKNNETKLQKLSDIN